MKRIRDRAGLVGGAALAAIVCSLPAVAGAQQAPAGAQQATYSFNIPSQDLGGALRAYGTAVRAPVAFDGAVTEGKRSAALHGSYDADQALHLMLGQSGLTFRHGRQGVRFIETAAATMQPASVSAPVVLAQAQLPAPAAPPVAQATNAGPSDIVVTGSRIQVEGYSQPTPVTVVGIELLQRDAKPSIGDSIRELPSVGNSASPNNGVNSINIVGGIAGLDTINLRNLGESRTLILIDGQRVVASNITGIVDLGTVPSILAQRIDVVTAGASAAWGSDAVSGVVNVVLDKQFTGFRGSVEAGDSFAWDHRSWRVQAAAGTGFDNNRGHVIVAMNYVDSPHNVYAKQRSWNKFAVLVDNPAYTPANDAPRYIHMNGGGSSKATQGGLITDGPFKGIQFVGNGIPVPYHPGTGKDPVTAGGDVDTSQATTASLAVGYNNFTAFGYGSYEFADWLKASVQLNYGQSKSRNNSDPASRPGTLRIALDNAFLPQSIKDAAAAYNLANPGSPISNIPMGTTNTNNITPDAKYTPDYLSEQLGIPIATTNRRLIRSVVSLYGDLGGDWSWEAYYQRGVLKVHQYTLSNVIGSKYNLAIDAVNDPSTGQIVCRSTLTDPGNGCAPLNIFGVGVASPEAIRYVNSPPEANWQRIRLEQNVVAGTIQGVLPFGLPAGNIATAFGAEYRSEKGKVDNDPGAKARIYSVGNFPYFRGKYHVKEAFLELDAPILKDSFVDQLSLNAAVRVTDYSTSGTVETWKFGFTSQVNADIRLRGTVSRDIRAPNLNENFSSGLATLGQGLDPHTGTTGVYYQVTQGNPNLKPEKATTWSAGVVLTPEFIPNATMSLDYYNIKLKGAIVQIGTQEVINRCVAGDNQFCDQLIYESATGPLLQVNVYPRNLAQLSTSGLDFQANYQFPLAAGDMNIRMLGGYVFSAQQDQLGVIINSAGAVSPDNVVRGIPKAKATVSATYVQQGLSATIQSRFLGAAKLVYGWTPKDVDNNRIKPVAYVDLRASYQLLDSLQLFGAVDNLLNRAPPVVALSPSRGAGAYFDNAIVPGAVYDILGRSYRIGARLRF